MNKIDIEKLLKDYQSCDAKECDECLADRTVLSDGTNICTVLREHDAIIRERIIKALETAKPL